MSGPKSKSGRSVYGAGVTPFGIYLLSEAYQRSAETLMESPQRATPLFLQPCRLLYIHAMEGYLRAFLKLRGQVAHVTRSYQHDFARMLDDCLEQGLALSRSSSSIVRQVSALRASRVVVLTGFEHRTELRRALAKRADEHGFVLRDVTNY